MCNLFFILRCNFCNTPTHHINLLQIPRETIKSILYCQTQMGWGYSLNKIYIKYLVIRFLTYAALILALPVVILVSKHHNGLIHKPYLGHFWKGPLINEYLHLPNWRDLCKTLTLHLFTNLFFYYILERKERYPYITRFDNCETNLWVTLITEVGEMLSPRLDNLYSQTVVWLERIISKNNHQRTFQS